MSETAPQSALARLFVALQYVLPQRTLARLVYWLARSRIGWLKNALIGAFVGTFRPDMRDAEQPEPFAFESFNAFFTRALRAGTRPLESDPRAILAPVDGAVSQIGRLDGRWLVQAKGRAYELEALLAAPGEWAEVFRAGACATLYLAPRNYHRIHMPLSGTLCASWYVPGQLFSVNAMTAAGVTDLYARNERVVCVFATGSFSFALVLIGALFVGSIATVWHGEVTPRRPRPRRVQLLATRAASLTTLERGAELGRFNMGSTVILLLPPGRSVWQPALETGSDVRVGETLGLLT
jgi:phosphatidylserine decarboxylase